jgi:hypothetical protein
MHLLALLLLACDPADQPGDSIPDDSQLPVDSGDSGDSGDSAVPEPAVFGEVEAQLADAIPAVVVVDFELEGGQGSPWVRFGPEAEQARYTVAAEPADDGHWRATLVGCPPETRCAYTVGDGTDEDQERSIDTGPGPDWLELSAVVHREPEPGFLLVPALAGRRGAVILDHRGRPVWWYTVPDIAAGGLVTRASLDPDGRSVWFNQFDMGFEGEIEDYPSQLVQVALDGSEHTQFPIPDTHHDFHLLDDGGLMWLGLEDRFFDGERVRGDRLVLRTAAGEERELWNGWETLDYDEEGPHTMAWTIANHLERDPGGGEDGWAISFKNLDTIVGVDARTGEITWRLGQEEPATAPRPPFQGQHGFTLLDDGIVLFDNSGDPAGSRVLELAFEPGDERATGRWEHPGPQRSLILGDALRLDDGTTAIAWGEGGVVEWLDAEGEPMLEVSFLRGTEPHAIGFLEFQPLIGVVGSEG